MSFAVSKTESHRSSSRRPTTTTNPSSISVSTRTTRPTVTGEAPPAYSTKPVANARPPTTINNSNASGHASAALQSIASSRRHSPDRLVSTRSRATSTPSSPSKPRRPTTSPSTASPASSSRGFPSPTGPRSQVNKPTSSLSSSSQRPRTADSKMPSPHLPSTLTQSYRSPGLSINPLLIPSTSSEPPPKYSGHYSTQNSASSAQLNTKLHSEAHSFETTNLTTVAASRKLDQSNSGLQASRSVSRKSSSDLRSGSSSKPSRPSLSTEAFPTSQNQTLSSRAPTARITTMRSSPNPSHSSTKSPESDMTSPLSPPSGSLSAPSPSRYRSSPTPQRTPSTSVSSATSINHCIISDSSRAKSPGMSASPALDSLPQRLAVDDMKRLLSKPASIMSASDSDGGYRSVAGHPSARRRTAMVSSDDDMGGSGYRSSPGRLSTSFAAPQFAVQEDLELSDADEHAAVRLNLTLPLGSTSKPASNEKRQKALLKRKPSNGNKVPNTSIFPASYTESKIKATGSSSNSKVRSVSMSPAARQRDPVPVETSASGLTPASALVMAYKQQQEAQSKEKKSNETERPKGSPANSIRDDGTLSSTPRPSTSISPALDAASESSPPATPYYTVFGSTSGKIVAVGGPEDAWSELSLGSAFVAGLGAGLGLDGHTPERTTYITGGRPRLPPKPTSSSGLGRSLSRKMSGRWRKGSNAADDIEWEKIEPPSSLSMDRERERVARVDTVLLELEERGRMSLQERRGHHRKATLTKAEGLPSAKALRVSVEQHAMPADNTAVPTMSTTSSGTTTPKYEESVTNLSMSRKSEPLSGSGGSKLWKLMKRISTGGLRDKFADVSPTETPPPVPAIPKDYLSMVNSPKSMDGHQNPGLMSKFAQTRSSLSAPRPSFSTVTVRPSTGTSSSHPSTTTRSSSPVSSDIASAKFFNRSQSARSSSSSYGDEIVPPVPNTLIGQHIIPPNELYKLTMSVSLQGDRSSTKSSVGKSSLGQRSLGQTSIGQSSHGKINHRSKRSMSSPEKWTQPSSMGIEPPTLPSLPVPPSRRKLTKKEPPQISSPTIPEFSTESPINTFPSRKSMSNAPDSGRSLSPPPHRPSRSPHRPSPTTSTSSSRVASPIPLGHPPPLPNPAPVTLHLRRASTASHATARPKSYASIFGPTPTPLTAQFREQHNPKSSRTEQEKADMWDDLLERSARAGGTIHLHGGDNLASDQLRFSAVGTDLEMESDID